MHSQYMFNLQAVNAAYQGSQPMLYGSLSYRDQWVGLAGAPRESELYFFSSIGKKPYAVGFQATHETVGARKVSGLAGSYAYHVRLNRRDMKLGFALRAGLYQYGFDQAKLNPESTSDQTLIGIRPTQWVPLFDFAAFWYTKKSYFGIQTSQLNQPRFEATLGADGRLVPHTFIVGGKTWKLNEDIDFKPSFLVRIVKAAPLSADLNVAFLYRKKLWLAGGYRLKSGVDALVQYLVGNNLRIGYSFDLTTNSLGVAQGGTHEICISYEAKLFKSKVVSPRYF